MPVSHTESPEVIDPLLERLGTAVVSLDARLRVVVLNSAAEALFRVSARQVRGLSVDRALPQLHSVMQRLRQSMESKMVYTERELELVRPGTETETVDLTVTPLDPPSGAHALILECFSLDRHLQISREEQVRAQHRVNREVIRGLAHEIKNPLSGLRGAAQLLERELGDSELRAYTGVIIREADRLRNLVDRLLGPNKPLVKSPTNIHRVLEHVYQLVSTSLPEGVELMRDYDPSIPEIPADGEQLVQAVLNVVRNAVEAVSGSTGGTGRVMLRTRAQRQYTIGGRRHRLVVRIDVVDDGPGFDDTLRQRIFFPLVTTRATGSGLGLPITQYLVHGHGGAMDCSSRSGETVFSIYLPLEENE